MPYHFLEDVSLAEVAYRVKAESLVQLFEEAAKALTEVMVNSDSLSAIETKEIRLQAEDIDTLLYRFLNALVAIKDSERMLFKQFEVEIKGNYNLVCIMHGERIDSSKHELKDDVKGVSLYLFGIKKVENYYLADIVLDI